jgi:tetratricopeptide (TPR) repeat protein
MPAFIRVSVLIVALAGFAGCAPSPVAEHITRGHQISLQGNWDESISAFTQAAAVATEKETLVSSYSSRCEAYIWKGLNETALEDCNRSMRVKPDVLGYPYAARGRIFAMMGYYEWALEDFDRAIDLGGTGGNNAKVIAYGGKARVFATSEDSELRDSERSVKFAEKAVSLENRLITPAYKILHRDTLAAAHAEAGRFDTAVEEQKKTISIVKENGWDPITLYGDTLLRILNRHLRQFEAGKPLRGGIY